MGKHVSDRNLKKWDINSWEEIESVKIGEYKVDPAAHQVTTSIDDDIITILYQYAADDDDKVNQIDFLDANSYEIIKSLYFKECSTIKYTPDGRYFIVANYIREEEQFYINVIDSQSFEIISKIKTGILLPSSNPNMKFLPDNRTIMTAEQQRISFYDLESGARTRELFLGEEYFALAIGYSPDLTCLFIQSSIMNKENNFGIYDFQTFEQKYRYESEHILKLSYLNVLQNYKLLAQSSRGIFYLNDKCNYVSVKDENNPKETIVFPNPANGTVTIEFDLPINSITRIVLTDILGNELEQISNSPMQAGHNTIYWDSTNLAPGIYMIRIESEGYNCVIKLIKEG